MMMMMMIADLKRAAMFQCPHTEADGDDRDAEERNEDENPQHLMWITAELVADQQLKHQQQQLQTRRHYHRLVLCVRISLHPETIIHTDSVVKVVL